MPRSMSEALREAFERAPSTQANLERAEDKTQKTEAAEPGDGEPGDGELLETTKQELPVAGESGDVELEYANDLPQVLGIEPEDFYRLELKLDGADPVPLGQIKDRLQQAEAERAEIAQQRAQLEQAQQQFREQAMQYGAASQVVTERMQKAHARMSTIQESYPTLQQDWARREKNDPGQVALERQRVSEQYSAAQAELQAAQQEATQQQQAGYQQWIVQQHQILSQAVPDWAVPEKRQSIQERVGKLAVERYGATPDDLNRLDARMIMLLLDAEKGIQAQEGAKSAVAKVRSAPKAPVRGVRVKNAQMNKQRVQELETRARTSRTRKDIVAATRGILAEALAEK